MAMKFHEVKALAREYSSRIVSSEVEWKSYLASTGPIYKYPFREQILIYAQRPDATAVASMEIWNDRMGCWVNRGATGIALIEDEAARKLKYVFDVKDVHESKYGGRKPRLWEMIPEAEGLALERLEGIYGSTDPNGSLSDRIKELTQRIAEDVVPDLLEGLSEEYIAKADQLNGETILAHYIETLSSSMAYMILSSFKVSESELQKIQFRYIGEFDSPRTLMVFGDTLQRQTEPVLREIGKAVFLYEKEKQTETNDVRASRPLTPIIPERGLESNRSNSYNANNQIEDTGSGEERSNYGSNERGNQIGVHAGGRLSDSESDSEPGADGTADEVRNPSERLSQRREERSLHSDVAFGRVAGALSVDSEAGAGASGIDHGSDGESRGSGREAESRGSDGLGTPDEQHQGESGGDRSDGDRLRIDEEPDVMPDPAAQTEEMESSEAPAEKEGAGVAAPEGQLTLATLFPSFEEQMGTIAAAEASVKHTVPAAFQLSEEQISNILRTGSGRDDSRKRIFAKYQVGKSPEKMVAFLKSEYGKVGKGFTFGEDPVSVWFDEDGMKAGYGMSAHENTILTMSWEDIESRIRGMVTEGTYISREEAWLVDQSERKRIASDLFFFFRDGLDGMPESLQIAANNYPDSEAHIMELLASEEGRIRIYEEVDSAKDAIESGEKTLRWRYVKSPDYLLGEIADISLPKLDLPFSDNMVFMVEDFITQDELDHTITRGSGVSEGKLRIYRYFTEAHDTKDRVDFLKNEYGIGGSSGALPGSDHGYEDHDSKGLKIRKGGIIDPYVTVVLTWSVVAKRIGELIAADRYLSPAEKEVYETRALEEAKEDLSEEDSEIVSKPERITIDGFECTLTDEWEYNGGQYILGFLVDSDSFYIASVNAGGMKEEIFSFIYQPSREEVQERYLNALAEQGVEPPEENSFQPVEEQPDAVEAPGQEESSVDVSYTIYQLTRESPRDIHFADLEYLQAQGYTVNPTNYKEVYRASALSSGNPDVVLEGLYEQFNMYPPIDFRGHALSVSDIIVLRIHGEEKAYYVDSIGFKEVPEFLTKAETADESSSETEGSSDAPLAREAKEEAAPAAPEIDMTGAVNYRLRESEPGAGSPKEKFRNNIKAIDLLQQLEAEHRIATPEEQQILAQYVGWGGLADAFDETKDSWNAEYHELKDLLSDDEYKAARGSVLNAHYTSPVIIQTIYEALKGMGFSKGNILEPAMGIGHFFGMLPDSMRESRLYGVELDPISGRIAKQLYPKANVQVTGFEQTHFPNNFFDVAVGNVPFGNYRVSDRGYDKLGFMIHDYFFAKTLDKVRPGGIIAFVTSKGTLDKQSPQVRKYIAQRVELIGAIRLPNTAFKNAGTEVTSDILFLQKRDRIVDIEPDWVHLGMDDNGIPMNQYFVDHPEMIVGKMAEVSGPYGMETACLPDDTIPLEAGLRDALWNLMQHTQNRYEEADSSAEEELALDTIPADPNVRNFSYTLSDGKLYYRENSVMKPVEVSDNQRKRIIALIGIREITKELINMQLEDYSDAAIERKQAELNTAYDRFSKEFGLISSRTNKTAFSEDQSYCLLCSLEKVDEEGEFAGKADMFTRRTIQTAKVVTSVDTASEALAVSLAEKASVDLPYMASLASKTEEEIVEELSGVIYKNPLTEHYETADEYLSGNVREKLTFARTAAESHPEYSVNVAALEKVMPKPLDASEIDVRLGAPWIDQKYIEEFMMDTFNTPYRLVYRGYIKVFYSPVTGKWNISGKKQDSYNPLVTTTYGTSRKSAYEILEESLNLTDSRVYDTIMEDGKEKRILNKKETTLASQKQDAIREAFKD